MTDTFPDVGQLGDRAAYALYDLAGRLAELDSPGVALWASALADALLARLSQCATGLWPSWVSEPVELSTLDDAELTAMLQLFSGEGFAFHSHPVVASWCRQLVQMITGENTRRGYDAVMAKLDMQMWEHEQIRGRPGDTSDLPKWSEVSRPPDDELH